MSNEQPHDPTITLRLELGRVTDQRDAFKAALNTELLKVAKVAIYQAMLDADSKAADTIGCMGVEVDDLRKENARLKAEVDLWKLRSDNWQKLVQVGKDNADSLESELYTKAGLCRSVMAEARRLRKAGDDLADALGDTSLSEEDMEKLTQEWDRAVKEVQS
jgi:FtsZ-binding cell division protein ZapB